MWYCQVRLCKVQVQLNVVVFCIGGMGFGNVECRLGFLPFDEMLSGLG